MGTAVSGESGGRGPLELELGCRDTAAFRWRSGEAHPSRQWGAPALLHCTGEHGLKLINSGIRKKKFSVSNSIILFTRGPDFQVHEQRVSINKSGACTFIIHCVLYITMLHVILGAFIQG